MTHSAYTRAVDMFEDLVRAPQSDLHNTPARLIQTAGIAPTSGYRHVATLEAEGFLRRNETGIYLTGLSALRTGLRAHGAGALAPMAQPVLVQLRQATQHTSFLAIAKDLDLMIGPHSLGRDTRDLTLSRSYSFETIPDLSIGKVIEADLRHLEDGIPRRMRALLVPVLTTTSSIVLLGMALNSSRGVTPGLTEALQSAFGQVAGALHGV